MGPLHKVVVTLIYMVKSPEASYHFYVAKLSLHFIPSTLQLSNCAEFLGANSRFYTKVVLLTRQDTFAVEL